MAEVKMSGPFTTQLRILTPIIFLKRALKSVTRTFKAFLILFKRPQIYII